MGYKRVSGQNLVIFLVYHGYYGRVKESKRLKEGEEEKWDSGRKMWTICTYWTSLGLYI